MRKFPCLLLIVIPALTSYARADEPGAPPPTGANQPNADAAKTLAPPPRQVTLYIEDWAHLAKVTRPDALLFDRADSLASRDTARGQIATSGLLVGGSAAVAGTIARLGTDHWTSLSKWGVAGGLSVVVVSLVTAWLVAPDRSDLVSVVNEWNQRHPDHPLAP